MVPCDVSAIILAGGKSSRMGKNKAELTINGITLLEIQIKKCRSIGIDDVIISGYSGSVPGTRTVPDIISGKGPLGGIHAGLTASKNKSCLVLSVDVPLISPVTLKELISAHSGGITMLDNDGKAEPLISVYDSSLADTAAGILQTERTSVMRLTDTADVSFYKYQGEKDLLFNCNTPVDFSRIPEIASRLLRHQEEVSTFFCRKNEVRLVKIGGVNTVRKTFASAAPMEREKQIYQMLCGVCHTPEYFPGTGNNLYLSYVPGVTFLELLEKQEREKYIDASLWERLAWLLADINKKTGIVNPDVNLRNYLYNEELDRIYLIDFEECKEGNIAETAAEICACILLYDPVNTEIKRNVSAIMQEQFCRLLSIDPAELEKEVFRHSELIRERRNQKKKN